MRSTVLLPFHTAADRKAAAQFLAALVRESVGFTTSISNEMPEVANAEMTVTFTGAF